MSTVIPTEKLGNAETVLLSERKHRIRFLVGDIYNEIKDGKTLDVAMGRWSLMKALFPELFVVGVDHNVPERPPDEFYRVNLKKDLPFEHEAFSLVFAGEIIEHVGERAALNLLNELYRVLEPNGFLLLTTPNGFRSKIKDVLGRAGLEEHEREFSYREMKKMLVDAGFKIVYSVSTSSASGSISRGYPRRPSIFRLFLRR